MFCTCEHPQASANTHEHCFNSLKNLLTLGSGASLVQAADDTMSASISTPDELRTGPAFTASVLMSGSLPAKRAAISNAAIGPAASSS